MTEEQIVNNEEPKEQVKVETSEQSNTEDINWKSFREERKKDREARQRAEEEAQRRAKEAEALKQAMDAILNKDTKNDNFEDQTDDDKAKIIKEVNRIIDEREKKREAERRQRELQETPIRLKREYPDFDKVVNQENIDYLEYKFPHIKNALENLPEGYDKWRDVYKTIKQFVPTTQEDQKRADENMRKPKSLSSGIVSNGDVAPVIISDQTKAANWERMRRSMKEV